MLPMDEDKLYERMLTELRDFPTRALRPTPTRPLEAQDCAPPPFKRELEAAVDALAQRLEAARVDQVEAIRERLAVDVQRREMLEAIQGTEYRHPQGPTREEVWRLVDAQPGRTLLNSSIRRGRYQLEPVLYEDFYIVRMIR